MLTKRRSTVLSLIFVLCGAAIIFLTPVILKTIIRANLVLTPGSKIFDLWKHFPTRVPTDIYFFNWTNPEQIHNLSVKPQFEQTGPYRFMVDLDKTDIQWNDNGTVTYKPYKFWYYDQNEKNGDLEDLITGLNPVALASAHKSRTWSYIVRKGFSLSLAGLKTSISITRTVDELLFTGYPDPLVKIARTFPFFAGTELPPWDRFGWFYTRNGTNDIDGVYNVGTGIGTTFAKLYNWKYFDKSPYFPDECSEFGGTTGENFAPESLGDFIKIFSPEMCRPVILQYGGSTHVNGVVGYKYYFGDHMLDNGTKYPRNKCFCNGDCLPSGVFNVSSCRYGAPAFGSLPHFHKADPYYNDLIEGSRPNDTTHDFYVIVEPKTGIPLKVRVRIQLNLMLQSISSVAMYENVPRALFPVLWFDHQIDAPSDVIYMLKCLQKIPFICTTVGVLLVLAGLGLSFYYVAMQRKKAKKRAKKRERNSCKDSLMGTQKDKN